MEIKYEITPTDLAYYSKETAKTADVTKVYTVILTSITILYMLSDAIIALVSVFRNDGSITVSSFNILPRFIAVLIVSALTYIVLTNYSKYAARKALRMTTGKNGSFCLHTLEIGDDGFVESTEVNRSFHSWEGVENIAETANYVTIYIKLSAGYFIPKRAFENEGQIKEFITRVSSYIIAANRANKEQPATN